MASSHVPAFPSAGSIVRPPRPVAAGGGGLVPTTAPPRRVGPFRNAWRSLFSRPGGVSPLPIPQGVTQVPLGAVTPTLRYLGMGGRR